MANRYLDPNRPLPRLLGRGLDAIVEKKGRHTWPVDPTAGQRRRRYKDALCHVDVEPNHEKREVYGAEMQANLRAYGTTVDLLLVAQAEMRVDFGCRQAARVGIAHLLTLKDRRRG